MRRSLATCLVALILTVPCVLADEGKPDTGTALKKADRLYREGAFAEALKRYEAVIASGATGGAILYKLGTCYGQALGNKEKELELKRQAAPMLEKEIAGGAGPLSAYYYLSAIYINDLHDPVKGTEVARRGIELIESSRMKASGGPESEFRRARLYSHLGRDAEAARHYESFIEVARVKASETSRAAVTFALKSLGEHRMNSGDFAGSGRAYAELLKLTPLDDRARHQLGLAQLRGGRAGEAARTWSSAASDQYRTEMIYMSNVATRFVRAGKPTSSKLAPDAATMAEEALVQKILEAGRTLAEIRAVEEKARKEAEELASVEEQAVKEAKAALSPEEVKARIQQMKKERQAARKKDPEAFKKQEQSIWTALNTQSLPPPEAGSERPVSPERAAAEKEFYYLMVELVKRGPVIRDFCFQNGLVDLIFR